MLTTNPHMKYIIQSPDFHTPWLGLISARKFSERSTNQIILTESPLSRTISPDSRKFYEPGIRPQIQHLEKKSWEKLV